MQKKAEMQKNSRKCTFDFKINAKKDINAKKGRKYIFNFEIHTKKYQKKEKRKHIYLDFFRFYIPCAFFCISNLKIHIKKDKNAKKA